jgi:cytochrome b561
MDAAIAPARTGYDAIHKSLHWLLVLLIIGQYAAGFIMPDITSIETVSGAWLWHLALGPTILLVALLKLGWRILRPVPLPTDIPRWQQIAARAVHDSLYLLLIVIPDLGWAMASSQSMDAKLFGLITLPRIAAPLAGWADVAGDAHVALVYVLLVLIGVHVAAALYHYFVRRDRVLQRMLP